MSDSTRNDLRYIIYTLGGFYLMYVAKTMYDSYEALSGTTKILNLICMVVFGVGGLAIAALGVYSLVVRLKNGVKATEEMPEAEAAEVAEDSEEAVKEIEAAEETDVAETEE